MSDSHDITGGLDLLGDWLDAKGYTEEAGLCTRAMDEINALREALRPFSDMAKYYDANGIPTTRLIANVQIRLLRAARAAMGDE